MWNFDESIAREGTGCIKYDRRKETFGKDDVIPMWVADMDFRTPGFIVSALQQRLDHQLYGYTFRTPEYYSSIIDWHKRRHNWTIEHDWIMFTPGVVPALNFATLAFTNPGDSVVVQPPVYFPFFSAVEAHGRKLIYNRLKETADGWKMDLDALEKSIDATTRMIILSNPHNPVGRVWSKEELQDLAALCIRHNIIILSDEIHCDLVLPGYTHIPVASLSPEVADRTITCISPSKTFNLAGLSTSSVVISNPELRKKFKRITESLHVSNGNIFGIVASAAAYSEGDKWLDSLLEYIDGNIDYVTDYLHKMVPEIIPSVTEATYLLWLDCRKFGMKGTELMSFFVSRANIGMNEGSTFGAGGEGFMRMNVATTRSNVIKALENIESTVSSTR
jgi:cystathionine beta-lyase